MAKRITIRFNDKEEAELELYKKTFGLDDDSKAVKSAISGYNNYLKNVTQTFFPPNYEVALIRKRKTQKIDRKIYD